MAANRSFITDEIGATAVEFALVAWMLLVTILFVMSVGIVLYFNQALDYATYRAGRQVMIGAVQKAGATQAGFLSSYLCPYLPATLSCSNVIVNLQTVVPGAQPSGYYSFVNSNQTALIVPPLNNNSTQYSTGSQGSYEYLQVIYPLTFLPAVITSYLSNATYNGSPAILLISTTAFRNEQY